MVRKAGGLWLCVDGPGLAPRSSQQGTLRPGGEGRGTGNMTPPTGPFDKLRTKVGLIMRRRAADG